MTEEEALCEARAALPPGRYRHFKGETYRVLGIARHSETGEPVVVYHHVSSPEHWCVRLADMFRETVDRDGYRGPRFAYQGD